MSRRLFWDAFVRSRWVQGVALTLAAALFVVQCGREGGAARDLSKLSYDSLPAKAPRPIKPADKLHIAVGELEGLLAIQAKRHLSGKQLDKAHAARRRIVIELHTLEHRFAADRAKLHKLGAKAALTRLDKIATKTLKLDRSLRSALGQVPGSGEKASAPAAEATKVLTALSPERKEQPLSSNLGFDAHNAKRRSPELSAGITPAYSSPVPTESPSDLPRLPGQEDLDTSAETTVTPAIHDLAQQLGGDPVKIYEYVRNNIAYEPYYGIRKGADQTLAEKSGSDADQDALLISLLRDSGVHARFVQGVAQLPAAKAANWLGIDTAGGQRLDSAPDILASGGIPTTQVRANGALVKVRFDHFWVEAYVPNDAYRGNEEQIGGKTWLPLDPSIKESRFTRPKEDFRSLLRPAAQKLVDDVGSNSEAEGDDAAVLPNADEMRATNEAVAHQANDILTNHGISSQSTVSELVGSTDIRAVSTPYLPSSLPEQVLSVSGELRRVPASLQARVSFSVSGSDPLSLPSSDPEDSSGGGLSFTASTTDLANKRITLAYVPASETDAEVIDAYHGLLNAPTYAAALVPVLRVAGHVVARGHTAVSTGYTQKFQITYKSPGYAADTVTNPVYVGSLSAVGLDLGEIATQELGARTRALRELGSSTTPENVMTDLRGGEILSELTALYFLRNDQFNEIAARTMGVYQSRDLSGAIAATSVTPTYVSSFPVSVAFDGLQMDVDQDSQVVVSKSVSDPTINPYMRLSGGWASSSESAVFTYALGWDAVSTMDVLRAAAAQGVAVHRVSSANVQSELERLQLPAGVEGEIARVVARPGVEVLTPERELTIGRWTGVGYVVSDGTGADYRISGGISGAKSPTPPPPSSGPCAPPPTSDPGLPQYRPFCPFSDSVPHFTGQVEDATQCDWAILIAFTVVMLIFVALALSILTGITIPLLAGELGGLTSLEALIAAGHTLPAVGGAGAPGVAAFIIAGREAEECGLF